MKLPRKWEGEAPNNKQYYNWASQSSVWRNIHHKEDYKAYAGIIMYIWS